MTCSSARSGSWRARCTSIIVTRVSTRTTIAGTLNAADMLNVNFTFYPATGPMSFTVYATNLLDEVTFGGDTQLPDSPAFGGGVPPGSRPPPTFSPLNKGRVIGAEVRLKF